MKTTGALHHVPGKGLRIGIVVSRFNEHLTVKLLEGAEKTLRDHKVRKIETVWVPGAFEIPLILQYLAQKKKFHALIAIGAVVRGETPHFDYVAGECSRGVMEVMLREKIPIAFGVLTTDTEEQALERIGGRQGHKGEEAALVAIEMAGLIRKNSPPL